MLKKIIICIVIGHLRGTVKNIPQGAVRVELWVGQCSGGDTLGDASTGWNSVSWIMIEEVSRPHS